MRLCGLTGGRCLATLPAHRQRVAAAAVRCSSSSDSGSQPSPSDKPSGFKGFGKEPEQPPPSTAEALVQSLGGLSNAAGRVSSSNNVVLGATDASEDKWRELDNQVNQYPGQRTFKAIGSGGDDFVVSMTRCVEAVVGTVHQECVNQRLSSGGKYISVTVGPVWVETPEQVLEIFANMKKDGRMKFYL